MWKDAGSLFYSCYFFTANILLSEIISVLNYKIRHEIYVHDLTMTKQQLVHVKAS